MAADMAKGGNAVTRIALIVLPLYVAFGCTAGLVQVALPVTLQAAGLGVEATGMMALLFLPFGISLLWAPVVDRYRLPALGRRKGWIALCQAVTVAALLLAAMAGPERTAILIAAMAIVAFSAATMDVALDGYMAETSSPKNRSVRGGIKVGGMLFGTAVGSVAVLYLLQWVGWGPAILAVALASALACVPFVMHRETTARNRPREWPSVWRFLAAQGMVPRMALVVLAGMALGAAPAAARLHLVERGLSLTVVGAIFGPLSAASGLAGALAGALAARLSKPSYALLCAAGLFGVAMATLFGFLVKGGTDPFLLGCIMATSAIAYGALYAGLSAVAMGWVHHDQAATDYSVTQSGWNLSLVAGSALGGIGLAGLKLGLFPTAGVAVFAAIGLLLCLGGASGERVSPSLEASGH